MPHHRFSLLPVMSGRRPALFALAAALLLAPSVTGGAIQERQPPGPLSPAHQESPGVSSCSACHTPEGAAAPEKCLACHEEIARQPTSSKGYHRDKPGDCAVCHTEHQGPGTSLVPLDREDFDHSETGTALEGAHIGVNDCDRCHRPEISFPRKKSKSYILTNSGCRACHNPPHPGRQDDCLACHSKNSWIVDREGVTQP